MKFGTEKTEIKSNMKNTSNFTIDMNAKSFSILTTNLYSDPIEAVIRELCCNALDAHKDTNNTETPFVIYLPTNLKPELVIEDFGIGLSDEQVFDVYTTFFRSTKTTSNNVTGCLGLGSKTPFAITESFFVESFYDGTYNKYVMYMDEDGTPSITKITTAPTERVNGMKITVPISDSKHNDIRWSSEEILSFFPKESYVVKRGSVNLEKLNKIEMMEGVSIVKHAPSFLKHSNLHVVQGCVRYPVNLEKINEKNKFFINNIVDYNSTLIINIPIGKATMNPSRESLHYDEMTIKNINKMIENFKFDLLMWIDYSIWNEPITEVYKFVAKLKGYSKGFIKYMTDYVPQFNTHYKNIYKSVGIDGFDTTANTSERFFYDDNRQHSDQKYNRVGNMASFVNFIYEPTDVSRTLFFFCDKKAGYLKRIQILSEEGIFDSKIKNIYTVFSKEHTMDEVEEIIRKMHGHDKFTFSYDLSDIELPKAVGPEKVTNVLKYDSPSWFNMLKVEEIEELDPEKTFYVDMLRNETSIITENGDKWFRKHNFNYLLNLGYTIIGLRSAALKRYRKMFKPLTQKTAKRVLKGINYKEVCSCIKQKKLQQSKVLRNMDKKYIEFMGSTKKANILKVAYETIKHEFDNTSFVKIKNHTHFMKSIFDDDYVNKKMEVYRKRYGKMRGYIDNQFNELMVIRFAPERNISKFGEIKHERTIKKLLKAIDII